MENKKTDMKRTRPLFKVMPSKLYTHNLEFSKWMLIQDTSYSCIDLISTSQPNLSKKSGVHSSKYSNLHHHVSWANFNLRVFLSSLLLATQILMYIRRQLFSNTNIYSIALFWASSLFFQFRFCSKLWAYLFFKKFLQFIRYP